MRLHLVTGVLFIGFILVGFRLAEHKPLWNDEYYSFISSTVGTSYGQMLKGGIAEGNNSPLFYALQKLQCDVCHYRLRDAWQQGHWTGPETYERIFLRIQPIIWVAVALSALFYFFSTRYSLLVGVYTLAVAFSSFMLWGYWAEARPYALWFSLSTLQMLVLLDLFKTEENTRSRDWTRLTVIHWFLAFTATISLIQIVAAGLALWIFCQRQWKRFALAIALPLVVCFFYYTAAPKYHFCFVDGPVSLINANIPKDRCMIFIIFTAALVVAGWKKGDWLLALETKYLVFSSLMLAFFAAVLIQLKLTAGPTGFQVSNRYLMSLTPLGIVGTVMFSNYLFQKAPSRMMRILVAVLLACLLAFRVQKTFDFSFFKRVWGPATVAASKNLNSV